MFGFVCPSVLDLWSGTGQTDGRTDDGHQHLTHPPYGGGGILIGYR